MVFTNIVEEAVLLFHHTGVWLPTVYIYDPSEVAKLQNLADCEAVLLFLQSVICVTWLVRYTCLRQIFHCTHRCFWSAKWF